MSNSVYDTFKRDNERRRNELVSKIFVYSIAAGPLMIAGKLLNVFPVMNIATPYLFTLLLVVCASCSKLLCKFYPYSPLSKYVIALLGETVVFVVSVDKNMCLFMSYVLVPIVSCMYLNKKFSYRLTAICYAAMLISIWYRAFFIAVYYPYVDSAFQWGIGYSFGLSLEFLVTIIFIYAINKKYCAVIDENLKAITTLQNTQEILTSSYSKLLTKKRPDMQEHLEKSSRYVKAVCSIIKQCKEFSALMDDEFISCLLSAAPLHDIGIIAVPDLILDKKELLTPTELQIFRRHTEFGEQLIRENLYTIENREFLKVARDIALSHHECWDGSGYPRGISGTDIPLSARIMAAANELEQMNHEYNAAPDFFEKNAHTRLLVLAGTVLDPVIADALSEQFNTIPWGNLDAASTAPQNPV